MLRSGLRGSRIERFAILLHRDGKGANAMRVLRMNMNRRLNPITFGAGSTFSTVSLDMTNRLKGTITINSTSAIRRMYFTF